eukprot:372504-Hanusia_phi.AAC.2
MFHRPPQPPPASRSWQLLSAPAPPSQQPSQQTAITPSSSRLLFDDATPSGSSSSSVPVPGLALPHSPPPEAPFTPQALEPAGEPISGVDMEEKMSGEKNRAFQCRGCRTGPGRRKGERAGKSNQGEL